jgi:hypothetical protein
VRRGQEEVEAQRRGAEEERRRRHAVEAKEQAEKEAPRIQKERTQRIAVEVVPNQTNKKDLKDSKSIQLPFGLVRGMAILLCVSSVALGPSNLNIGITLLIAGAILFAISLFLPH